MASSLYVGQRVSTGNSYVASAPVGTTFVKASDGTLQVTGIPKPVFNPGDRVYVRSKGRYARIVRMTDVKGLSNGLPPAGNQFYVGDEDPTVVRIAAEGDLQHC